MLSRLRSHVGHNVVGYIALFIALSGTAYAAKPLITGADVQDGSLTDADIADANKDGTAATPSLRTLGTGAQQAAAGNDSRLSDARTPTGTAGGDLTGTYPSPQLAPPEPWHEVGAPGEPGFSGAWANLGDPFSTAAFYRDRAGVVHLKGVVDGGTFCTTLCNVFFLPVGYQPAKTSIFEVSTADSAGFVHGRIDVWGVNTTAPGRVQTFAGGDQYVSLDEISFRCAPSGSNGCP